MKPFKKITIGILLAVLFLPVFMSCKPIDQTPAETEFAITPSDVTDVSATIQITPSVNDVTYYFNVINKHAYEGDNALIASDLEKLGNNIEKNLSKSKTSKSFSELLPETVYYAYAYALSADGSTDGKVTKIEFCTDVKAKPFVIKLTDIAPTSVTVTVTPHDNSIKYWHTVITSSMYENNDCSDPEGFKTFIKQTMDYNAAMAECTVQQLVEQITVSGSDTKVTDDLYPDTYYYALAVELDEDGYVVGDNYEIKEFSTLEAPMKDFTVEMTTSKVSATEADIEIRPSDSDQEWFAYYVSAIEYQEEFKTDEDLMMLFIDIFASKGMGVNRGAGVLKFNELSPETKYVAFCFAYDSDMKLYCSDLFTHEFTTEKAPEITDDQGVKFEFDITVDNTKDDKYSAITIVTEPSDPRAIYMTDVIEKSVYDEYGGTPEGIRQMWKDNLDAAMEEMHITARDWVEMFSHKGTDRYTYETFKQGRDLVVYAIHVNEVGQILSAPCVKEFDTRTK